MLKSYLQRLYDTIISRGDIVVEYLAFDDQAQRQGFIEGKLRFFDESLLDFDEAIIVRGREIVKFRYAYHYQNATGQLIFRYDNAPHYPDLPTHPHHKHVGDKVEAANIPDLSAILREIDQLIYPEQG
jgi:hypothetical protein